MPSRTTAIWAGAAGAVIIVAGAGAAYWTHPGLLRPVPPPATTAGASAAPPAATAAVATAATTALPAAAAPGATAPATAAPSAPAVVKPAFDVVNVDPTGETVVAGRAEPNAKVELRDDGKTVAEATANSEGQFVIIPPALPPGSHSLTLAAPGAPAAQTSNAIEVAVAAPEPKSVAAEPTPAKAAMPAPSSGPPPAETPSGSPSGVAVQSVEASAGGRLVAKGAASPNATVRLYLSGAFIGDAKTSADGRWTLTIKHGLTPGAYALRADAINPKDAAVLARAEVPFDYAISSSIPPPSGALVAEAGGAPSPADVVVDVVQTDHVVRGNTLWGESQKFYGDGSLYKLIFAANANQIKNPNLIYPGQVFVVPKEPKP